MKDTVPTEILPARPEGPQAPIGQQPLPVRHHPGALPTAPLPRPPTDGCAVASAVVGMVGIIPLVSQVAGLTLGIMALRRIHRAERAGIPVTGRVWAITGIVSSVFCLLAWLAIGLAFGAIVTILSQTAGALDKATQLPG